MTATLVLTREAGRNDELRHALETECRVLEVPLTTTEFRATEDVAADLDALVAATSFATVAFTSVRATAVARTVRDRLPGATLAAVGPATLAALVAALQPRPTVLTAPTPGGAALGAVISTGPVLLVGAAAPSPELATALAARQLVVAHLESHETRPVALDGLTCEELRIGDVVLIAAPSAWRVARAEIRRTAVVVVPGEATRAAVAAHHDHVIVAGADGLVEALRRAVRAAAELSER